MNYMITQRMANEPQWLWHRGVKPLFVQVCVSSFHTEGDRHVAKYAKEGLNKVAHIMFFKSDTDKDARL